MESLLKLIEKNAGKTVGIPFIISTLQFLLMLLHAMSDGIIDHQELEALLQAGNGVQMVFLALAIGYLQFRKK